jgi:hypothetical protein
MALALTRAATGQLLPPSTGNGQVTVSPDARRNFEAGVGFLHDPDGARYEPAYAAFKAAYQASPSWKILGNLGLCALKLERNTEAIEAYERYLAQGGREIEIAEQAQVTKDLQLLRSGSATVKLSLKGATGSGEILDRRMKSDGSQAVNVYPIDATAPLTLMLHEGHHQISAKVGGRESAWEITLSPGETKAYVFDLAAPSAAKAPNAQVPSEGPSATSSASPVRTIGFITAGVGAAMLVGGTITGLVGKSKLSDLENSCPNKQCPLDKTSDRDSIESLETTTNVLLIGGGVVAATGLVLIVVGKPARETATARMHLGPVRVLPSMGLTGGGIVAVGTF